MLRALILSSSLMIHAVPSLVAAEAGAPPKRYVAETGPFEVAKASKILLHDAQRGKELPVDALWPKGDGPFPLIVYSHGAFSSGDMVQNGPPKHWASYGYICLLPTHADSMKQLRASGLSRREALRKVMASKENGWSDVWSDRPADVTFLLNSLNLLEAAIPELNGKINREQIGVGGHSLGAYTAQLIGGATIDTPDGKNQSFADERVNAVLQLSGQGTDQQGLTKESWRSFTTPMMTMTGSRDRGAQRQGPEWKKEPFDFSPEGDKFHVDIEGAHHGSFNGHMRTPAQQKIFGYVQIATLAFWDAYLKEDPAAQAFLRSNGLATLSEEAVQIEWK